LDFSKKFRRQTIFEYKLCHPEGIFAVVGTDIASTRKDPYPDKVGIRWGGQDDIKQML
jgi:hypothetical protein